jgi:hypothetical protein
VIPNPGFQHRAGQEPEKYRKAARTSSRKIKSDGGRYRIRTYPHSTFSNTCGTRVATKVPQRKPTEQLLDTNWTLPIRGLISEPVS